ncbi:hypothetical protein JZO70_02375 [Enterococcus sp. 669A]|uniref:Uncharacterized protein n=1 Tax=Candidatus Enterococcus moelleringii TaxID=2815325 RepID=A0ABS3L5V3_9ENTE|nr:hypothetical protein [Enterococcus sp. 669A]MBO1304991.1 hypothetical protein [Enterococcus sp. 669A]
MLTKTQGIDIKLGIFFLWLVLIFTVANRWTPFAKNLLVVVVFLLFSFINFLMEENRGIFKKRRNNLLFELLLVFLLFLVTLYVR